MKTIGKLSLTALLSLSVLSNAMASASTDNQFKRLISKNGIGPLSEQAYCYTDSRGTFQGFNVDKKMKIASVTKVITSLWAVKKLGANYRYETKFYVKGTHMHIEGSNDPYMSNEKMIYIISSLNKLGITTLKSISFNNNIQINPGATANPHTERYPSFDSQYHTTLIKKYFNTKDWTDSLKADYKKYSNLAPKGRYVSNPTFSVENVYPSIMNPFGIVAYPIIPSGLKILTLKSPQLHKYLKNLNGWSNNYTSQAIFQGLGGASKFKDFAKNTYGLDDNELTLYTGSGLPDRTYGRKDNLASCRAVGLVTEHLKEELERQGKRIEDVLAVPGSDVGTLRKRLTGSGMLHASVGKTGTLDYVSALAGAINTKSGYSFYGIFNTTYSQKSYIAKGTQNEMVRVLFNELGGPKSFKYSAEAFLPYDKNQELKGMADDSADDLIDPDFSEVDGDMIIEE